MNAELINPFIQGSQGILEMICGEVPGLGKLFIKPLPYVADPVSITISIHGDVMGDVVYTMKNEAGCNIASKMMYGMPVQELDDMSMSALSELGNMISGNVATIFSGKGISIDITPPHFRINATSGDFPFVQSNSRVICVPLVFTNGDIFEVDVLLKE